jgi:hypothetical protein
MEQDGARFALSLDDAAVSFELLRHALRNPA